MTVLYTVLSIESPQCCAVTAGEEALPTAVRETLEELGVQFPKEVQCSVPFARLNCMRS
jgi:hypothetical protein